MALTLTIHDDGRRRRWVSPAQDREPDLLPADAPA